MIEVTVEAVVQSRGMCRFYVRYWRSESLDLGLVIITEQRQTHIGPPGRLVLSQPDSWQSPQKPLPSLEVYVQLWPRVPTFSDFYLPSNMRTTMIPSEAALSDQFLEAF